MLTEVISPLHTPCPILDPPTPSPTANPFLHPLPVQGSSISSRGEGRGGGGGGISERREKRARCKRDQGV
jgi:hypothetical protein